MNRKVKAIILVTSSVMAFGGLTINSTATKATTIKNATQHSSKTIGTNVRTISESLLEIPSIQQSGADALYRESGSRNETVQSDSIQYDLTGQKEEATVPVVEEPVEAPVVEEPILEVEEVLSAEYIDIDGTKYYAVVNSFEEDQALALKYGAGLYGIPNSCLFAFIKDGVIIFSLSTGYASVDLEYKEMAVEFFSSGGFSEYTGLVDNIKHVLETGEEVNRMIEDYIGYHISKNEKRIIISW